MRTATALLGRRGFVALAFALLLAGVSSGGASAQTGPVMTFVPRLAPSLAMTAPTSAGQPVQLAPNTGSPQQLWELTNPNFEESRTQIVNQETGLCLDVASTTAGASVIAATCSGSPSQQWVGPDQANGSFRFLNLNSPAGTPLVLTASVGGPGVVLTRNVGTDPTQEWLLQSPGLGEPPGSTLPATKDECRNGGWRSYGVFKNQGDCVSFGATGGKNPPAGSK
jgi:Ricin-type beta-trefoil lectin domain